MKTASKSTPIPRGFMGFSAAIAAVSLANPASAAQFGNFRYEVKHGSTVTITGPVHDPVGALVIPAKIEGKPVTEIGDFSFGNCRNITEVTFPEGITRIGKEGFESCPKLTKISLPESLDTIAYQAFASSDLRNLKIPARLRIISSNAFSANFRLHSVEIPEGVRVLGAQAFSFCGLETISLPASVKEVAPDCFRFSDLKRINVAAGNRAYSSVDGVLYDKSRTLLITCPPRKSGTVEVPEGVKRLATKSFYQCRELKKVVLPESLLAIEARSFSDCNDLKEINFPNGLKAIGHHAFSVTHLGDITIPASVDRIGGYAFVGCGLMNNVYFNGNAPSDIGEHVFDSNSRSNKPKPGFKVYFYEGSTGFTEPTWLGYDTVSLSPDAPVTNRLLFGAGWRN